MTVLDRVAARTAARRCLLEPDVDVLVPAAHALGVQRVADAHRQRGLYP